MRRPTSKEKRVIFNCIGGLKDDIVALERTDEELREEGVGYADVLGTFRTNLNVLLGICNKLQDEAEQ